jgi:hypothetical protein
MTTFAEDIKERKDFVKASRQAAGLEADALVTALEYRINELEADLENEQDLTVKLKGLLDGGLVELVGELSESLQCLVDCISETRGTDANAALHLAYSVITKAKESMP